MHKVYLGLGSNLGDKVRQLQKAIRLIDERVGQVLHQSSFIETEPWGFQPKSRFLNAVILCMTDMSPRQVLQLTQQIEREMGKTKAHATQRSPIGKLKSMNPKYFDRPIDIDILLYDDQTVDEPDLKIPHPLMHQRDFVMIPLREICDELPLCSAAQSTIDNPDSELV